MTRKLLWASWFSCAVLAAACGGGGGSSGGPAAGPPPPPANTLALVIDAGPPALAAANEVAANLLYASVTLCTPGSTTACQVIDHVQVDTGSVGLRILAQAMNGMATPSAIIDPASNSPLLECVQFADGYTWGSMVMADVTIGGRIITSLPVNVIGDAAAGTAPASCASGPAEQTVAQFGANGVLGVGNWLQDCGSFCVTNVVPAAYYVCPNQQCRSTTVALNHQAENPVALFPSDNNGIVIKLPAVGAPGAPIVDGALYFGIATQSDNALSSAVFYTLDNSGLLVTNYAGQMLTQSFIDSGSNAYFFNDSTITACTATNDTGYFCPGSSVMRSGTIQGINGVAQPVNFTVDNAGTLFGVAATAYPDLAGPNTAANGLSNSFDWGLPFFFGRTVYVLFETKSVAGTTGPAIAF